MTDPDEIRLEWSTYYDKLYKHDDYGVYDDNFKDLIEIEIEKYKSSDTHIKHLQGGLITVEEVNKYINKMKPGKAAGWDHITSEYLKHGGNIVTSTVTLVMNLIIQREQMPSHYKKGLLVPIPKAGKDPSFKDHNRGITLLSVLYKLLEMVILEREREWFAC